MAKVLYEKGVVALPEPKSVPAEEAGAGEVGHLLSSNMLVQGNRAARMGFEPTHPSMLVQMPEDLRAHSF